MLYLQTGYDLILEKKNQTDPFVGSEPECLIRKPGVEKEDRSCSCDLVREAEEDKLHKSSFKIILRVTPAEKGKLVKCFAEGH